MPPRNNFAVLGDAISLAILQDHDNQSSSKTSTAKPEPPPRLRYPLVWIDLEMTGLDVENDTILQIACIITDGKLKYTVEGPEITIHHDEDVLQNMNDWCKENHGKSGLTQAVRESEVSLTEAENAILDFIREHVPEPSCAQIAGNSIHVDLLFLRRYMPRLVDYLHYRIVDVSTIGELCRRWYPREYGKGPKKVNAHTAMSDIRESIEQLRFYKNTIFRDDETKKPTPWFGKK